MIGCPRGQPFLSLKGTNALASGSTRRCTRRYCISPFQGLEETLKKTRTAFRDPCFSIDNAALKAAGLVLPLALRSSS